MPRIRCRYEDCILLDAGYCTAERIELDPEMGCLTYQQAEDEPEVVAAWDEDEEAEDIDDDDELEWEEDEDEEEDDEDDEDEW